MDVLVVLLMTLPILGALLAVTVISSWRWSAGLLAVMGAGLVVLWVHHWIAANAPGYHESVDAGLAVGIIGLWSVAVVLAAVIYLAGVAWWYGMD